MSRDDALAVAVVAGPPGTALAGPTAAELWGLRGFETPEAVHVLIPHEARGFRHAGVVVHRSLTLATDRLPFDPARTRAERSITDTASWARSARHARAVVLASVQQRVTTVGRLADAMSARGPIRYAAVIRESLVDAAGGLDSLPEHDFARLLQTYGLPTPRRQSPVRGPSGRYRLDADFEPYHVAAEIDGAHHRDVLQSDYDLKRQNELTANGRVILRFSSYQVRHEADTVARTVRRALIAAGWGG